MMRSKNIYRKSIAACLFVVVFFVGCIPDPITVEVPQDDPKLVVWSQAVGGFGLVVYLAKSFSALEDTEDQGEEGTQELLNQILVDSADVSVEHLGEIYTLSKLTTGVFQTIELDVAPGDELTLRVYDYGTQQSVSSTTTVLESTEFDLLNATPETIIEEGDGMRVTFGFPDLPGPNWYLVNVLSQDAYNSENFINLTGQQGSEWQFIFSDDGLTGDRFENTTVLTRPSTDSLFFSVQNIPETYFDYLGDLGRGGSLFNQIIAEPINFESNVENGLGFFNFSQLSLGTTKIEE